MNEELLSALMDGEISALETRRVLSYIGGDVEARTRLDRYHAARAALHDSFPAMAVRGFADRVMSCLDHEPVPRRSVLSGKSTWIAYAAAAAISGVAVFGWWQDNARLAGRAPTASVQGPAGTETADDVASTNGSTAGETEMSADDRALLNSYLVNHSEHSAAGTMPYIRLVGFSAARQ